MAALGAAILPTGACVPQNRIPRVPLPVRWAEGAPRGQAEQLTVMLPGRISPTREFKTEGFFGMMAERFPGVDVVAADLHLAYFRNKSMVERLHVDVIEPERQAGKREVWLVGVSLGGLGAIIYALERPGEVDRVVLLSPFLGDDEIINEIEAAGGLDAWEPGTFSDEDFQRRLWRDFKLLAAGRWDSRFPEVWLGYTDEDRFTRSNALFAREMLDSKRVFTVPGDHDWPEWRQLFEAILESEGFGG